MPIETKQGFGPGTHAALKSPGTAFRLFAARFSSPTPERRETSLTQAGFVVAVAVVLAGLKQVRKACAFLRTPWPAILWSSLLVNASLGRALIA